MAKKAKTANETLPTRSKKEIFDLHYPDILKAKIALEEKLKEVSSVRGVYRSLLKAYKKAGGNQEALAIALEERKGDPQDRTRHYRDLADHFKWANIPIGAQLDMFGGLSPADAAEREQMGETVVGIDHGAYRAGQDASSRGENRDTCPYKGTSPKQKTLRESWELGWDDDQRERVMALGGKQGEPVPA
jgi:ribosome modulation factor